MTKEQKLPEPSYEFLSSLLCYSACGPCTVTCGFCKAQVEAQDEHDSITYYEIDGRTWIDDCPCNGPSRYEQWILCNRETILSFLGAKAFNELRDAKQFVRDVKQAGYKPQLIRDLDELD